MPCSDLKSQRRSSSRLDPPRCPGLYQDSVQQNQQPKAARQQLATLLASSCSMLLLCNVLFRC